MQVCPNIETSAKPLSAMPLSATPPEGHASEGHAYQHPVPQVFQRLVPKSAMVRSPKSASAQLRSAFEPEWAPIVRAAVALKESKRGKTIDASY